MLHRRKGGWTPLTIGVDSAGAAGARAPPPIIEMVGHCPTNKSREEFLKILKTSSETETKNLNTIRNSIMKTKIYLYHQCFQVFKASIRNKFTCKQKATISD